MYYQVNF